MALAAETVYFHPVGIPISYTEWSVTYDQNKVINITPHIPLWSTIHGVAVCVRQTVSDQCSICPFALLMDVPNARQTGYCSHLICNVTSVGIIGINASSCLAPQVNPAQKNAND
jgi:hypothetical protein